MRLCQLKFYSAFCFTLIFTFQFTTTFTYAAEKTGEKPVIAVYDLKSSGVSEPLVNALTDRIHDEVFHRNLYRIVARTDIDDVFKEQGFQLSGACDDSSCLMEVGRILGADFIIGGSVSLIEDNYTISVRIVNVQTGEVVKSYSTSKYKSSNALLDRGAVEIVDNLISARRKFDFLSSPYFWGGVTVSVAAGTAIYLQLTKDENPAETPAGTAYVIVVFP